MQQNTKRKLVLINPENKQRKGFIRDISTRFMPIGLGIVARLTPDNWEVELIDESFEEFKFIEADLVGITAFTANAFRAYEISAIYRAIGVTTVMGGIHASMYTAEAMQHFDAVLTRDAEGIWPRLISDFEEGKLQRLYDGGYVDVEEIARPKRDIFDKYPYVYDLVQTSRGCPMGCEFCSVTHMCGKTYRERKVEDVLDELKETKKHLLFFVDDNLVNNKKGADERAITLFKGMVNLGIKKHWLSQVAVNFADNEEVLRWARRAGCRLVLMGIEAEKADALKDIRKNLNLKRGVENYRSIFRRIHKHGIAILGTMIFAMESDSKEDLLARGRFIASSSIDSYQCTILTPLPGTVLHDKMLSKGTIINKNYPEDWQKYHCYLPVFNTPNLKQHEIYKLMTDIWSGLYNKEAIRRKLFRTLINTRSFSAAYWAYASNHNYGNMALEDAVKFDPDSVNEDMEWKNRKRSVFLKATDKFMFLTYQLYWQRLVKKYGG
ncbi:MAG TPA: radical SAM protein [Lentimicrobium sp.]|nr:radical SAM protein [Lentimicrobium sp.]